MMSELMDVLLAILILGFITSYNGPSSVNTMLANFIPNLIIIGIAFIVHEFAHRQVARKLGFFARFELWSFGALGSLLLSIATNGSVAFAAVGAVMIYPVADLWGRVRVMSEKDMFYVAVAGPLSNIGISIISVAAYLFIRNNWLLESAYINIWLSIFNLIPFPPLDGSRIFSYDWKIWTAIFLPLFIAFLYLSAMA